jgi:hypothetical protein
MIMKHFVTKTVAGVLLSGVTIAASADSIGLSFDVIAKSSSQVEFNLLAENIGTQPIYNVIIEPSFDEIPQLNYGDLSAGSQEGRYVNLQWAADEPPTLSWKITYVDANGNTVVEHQ